MNAAGKLLWLDFVSLNYKHIPLFLTYIRILAIVPVTILFYLPWALAPETCAAIYLLAAFTDFLDGYLARRWGATSALGAFLDPVADKLMVVTVLIMIATAVPSPWIAIPAVVVAFREVFVSALREWMATAGARGVVKVSWIGKCKTAVMMCSITPLLWKYREGFDSLIFQGGVFGLHISVVLCVWSGVRYLQAAWPTLTASVADVSKHEKSQKLTQ